MKYYFKVIYPLVVIAIGVGLAMGITYQLLENKLIETRKAEEEHALKQVIQGAVSFKKENIDGAEYYVAYGESDTVIGYIFKKEKNGYGGPVEALVGITNGVVDSIVILRMARETPGLGTKANSIEWLSQFKGITYDRIPKSKADFKNYGLDAISGATLTSLAVAGDILEAFNDYHKLSNAVVNTNISAATGASAISNQ